MCVSVSVSMLYRSQFFTDLNDTIHKNSIGDREEPYCLVRPCRSRSKGSTSAKLIFSSIFNEKIPIKVLDGIRKFFCRMKGHNKDTWKYYSN